MMMPFSRFSFSPHDDKEEYIGTAIAIAGHKNILA
jgi:hypothetical protein